MSTKLIGLSGRSALAVVVALLVLAGCSGSDDEGTLVVFAASSLTDAFDELAAAYEQAHPGAHIEVNLAGSAALREQILDGAPADVFATANRTVMADVVDAGAVHGEPTVFATNRLVLAVPAGNPANVTGIGDLGQDGLLVGLCAPAVPCGELAHAALELADVQPSLDTEEPDVRALLAKLADGELDVGMVYATDLVAADGAVDAIELRPDVETTTDYPIAAIAGEHRPAAGRFIAFVLSPDGQAILAEHGFGPAP